jgi:hypothetical protein
MHHIGVYNGDVHLPTYIFQQLTFRHHLCEDTVLYFAVAPVSEFQQ